MPTKNDLKNILEAHPKLAIFGFAHKPKFGPKTMSHTDKELEDGRKELLDNFDQFERAYDWLFDIQRSDKVNKRANSYSLKHIAERSAGGYVSNGALIAAALHHGFKMQKPRNDINVRFFMEQDSIIIADERSRSSTT